MKYVVEGLIEGKWFPIWHPTSDKFNGVEEYKKLKLFGSFEDYRLSETTDAGEHVGVVDIAKATDEFEAEGRYKKSGEMSIKDILAENREQDPDRP